MVDVESGEEHPKYQHRSGGTEAGLGRNEHGYRSE